MIIIILSDSYRSMNYCLLILEYTEFFVQMEKLSFTFIILSLLLPSLLWNEELFKLQLFDQWRAVAS